MNSSATFPVQLNLSVENIIALIESLPALEQERVFEQLRMKVFKAGWAALGAEIPQAGLSEAEIMKEVEAVRAMGNKTIIILDSNLFVSYYFGSAVRRRLNYILNFLNCIMRFECR